MADPVYTTDQKLAAYAVLLDAGFTHIGGRLDRKETDPEKQATLVEKDLQHAAEIGALPLVAATILKVQGYPQYSPDGRDQAREEIARLVNFAKMNGDSHLAIQCNLGNDNCRKTDIADNEMLTVLDLPLLHANDPLDNAPYAEKRRRGIPVDERGAFVFGAIDAMMNPQRYLHDASGAPISIATVAQNNPPDPQKIAQALDNDPAVDLNTARSQGARWAFSYQDASGIRYDGSQFLGAVGSKNVASNVRQ